MMPVHRILIGYNGTIQSEHTLELIAGINWQYEVEIHLAFIVQEPSGMADPLPDEIMESLSIRGQETLSDAARQVRKRFGNPILHLDAGDPNEKLLELAETLEPDLIVIGMTKHSSERILGSVSSNFIRSRKYPILLVP
ncbi:MAG TPA: universal stress protein [Nitrososphaeraceae archaeon]|jgi:nucleotide-binding universal stress UspA family protein